MAEYSDQQRDDVEYLVDMVEAFITQYTGVNDGLNHAAESSLNQLKGMLGDAQLAHAISLLSFELEERIRGHYDYDKHRMEIAKRRSTFRSYLNEKYPNRRT